MPVFMVYPNLASSVCKGVVVKETTTLVEFLEKANAKLNTTASMVFTRELMEVDEDEILRELDAKTHIVLCNSVEELVAQKQPTPDQQQVADPQQPQPQQPPPNQQPQQPLPNQQQQVAVPQQPQFEVVILHPRDDAQDQSNSPLERSFLEHLNDNISEIKESTPLRSNCTQLSVDNSISKSPMSTSARVNCPNVNSPMSMKLSSLRGRISHELPDFPPSLINQPTITSRLQIVDILFFHISKTTMYPYPADISEMVRKLLLRYPNLIDANGDGSSWVSSITNKFKNIRRKLPSHSKAFTCKRKIKDAVSADTSTSSATGEDAESIQAHEKTMCEEMERREPRLAVLKERMKYTFEERKAWVHASRPGVHEVLERYPALRFNQELIHQEIELDLKREVPTVGEFVAAKRRKLRTILKMDEATDDDDLLLTNLLKHLCPRASLVATEETIQPCVLSLNGEYVLKVENVTICKRTRLIDIVHAELCFIWVLNLEYPSNCKAFWQLLDAGVFNRQIPLSIKSSQIAKSIK